MKKIICFSLLVCIMLSCNSKKEVKSESEHKADTVKQAGISVAPYGKLPDGTAISQYTLNNGKGVAMKVINYGGIITSLTMADKNGNVEDVVLGYDSLAGYLKSNPYFGSLVGRYGNRIAKGKFNLDGKTYSLAVNNDPNHLHGGVKGFDNVYWNIEEANSDQGPALRLTYESKDMEEGYPGNLKVEVIYTLTNDNALDIKYSAVTDRKTVVNLTQHSYFNLSAGKSDILSHTLTLNCDKFVPVDKTLIPTGKLQDVKNTPFDFTTPHIIGERINDKHEQLDFGGGYDHCWVVNRKGDELTKTATLYDSASGRQVEVFTTEPGVQFYSGNFLDGSITGKGNITYKKRYGMCLETQHFPDSPNQPQFPSVILNPGETYRSETVYKFSVK